MSGSGSSAAASAPTSVPTSGRTGGALGWTLARLDRAREWFPLTGLGLAVAGASYLGLSRLAYGQLDLVWLVVGYVGLGLVLLSACVVAATAGGLSLWLRSIAGPGLLQLETGTSVATGFALPGLRWLPLVRLRTEWIRPAGVRCQTRFVHGRLQEFSQASDRGRHERLIRRVVVEDPFGLSRIKLRQLAEGSLEVLPHVGALGRVPVLSSLVSGDALPHPMGLEDGDRLELKRYAAGDPARLIHWKVFGRTRRLMVRMPERALTPARRMAAVQSAGPGDDATAAVARVALENHLLGADFRFGTDLEVGGTSEAGQGVQYVMGSSAARDLQAQGLTPFLEQVERSGPASVLVFAPSVAGAWLDAVAAASSRRPIHVVVGVDGLAEPAARGRLRGFLLHPGSQADGTPRPQLQEVVTRLERAGCRVTVLDRPSGRPLSATHRGVAPSHATFAEAS